MDINPHLANYLCWNPRKTSLRLSNSHICAAFIDNNIYYTDIQLKSGVCAFGQKTKHKLAIFYTSQKFEWKGVFTLCNWKHWLLIIVIIHHQPKKTNILLLKLLTSENASHIFGFCTVVWTKDKCGDFLYIFLLSINHRKMKGRRIQTAQIKTNPRNKESEKQHTLLYVFAFYVCIYNMCKRTIVYLCRWIVFCCDVSFLCIKTKSQSGVLVWQQQGVDTVEGGKGAWAMLIISDTSWWQPFRTIKPFTQQFTLG